MNQQPKKASRRPRDSGASFPVMIVWVVLATIILPALVVGAEAQRLPKSEAENGMVLAQGKAEVRKVEPAGIHPDLAGALREANEKGKLLLVDFYGAWCPWCIRMDKTFADAEVNKTVSEKFHYLKLDIGRFERHEDCTRYYNVTGIPHIIVFNPNGSVRTQAEGYLDVAPFKAFLAEAVAGKERPKRPIHPDLAGALREANAKSKLLLVDFYGAWCPWCVRMDKTLEDPPVKALLSEKFHYFKLDVGRFERHVECIKQYGVRGIPHIIVFNADGSVCVSAAGYKKPAAFVDFLKQAVKKAAAKPEPVVFKMQEFPAESDPVLAACRKAQDLGKILLVYFSAPGNPGCEQMDAALASTQAEELLTKSFALFRINQPEHDRLARLYGCSQAPFLIIFKGDGNVATFTEKALDADALRKLLEEGMRIGGEEKKTSAPLESRPKASQATRATLLCDGVVIKKDAIILCHREPWKEPLGARSGGSSLPGMVWRAHALQQER